MGGSKAGDKMALNASVRAVYAYDTLKKAMNDRYRANKAMHDDSDDDDDDGDEAMNGTDVESNGNRNGHQLLSDQEISEILKGSGFDHDIDPQIMHKLKAALAYNNLDYANLYVTSQNDKENCYNRILREPSLTNIAEKLPSLYNLAYNVYTRTCFLASIFFYTRHLFFMVLF